VTADTGTAPAGRSGTGQDGPGPGDSGRAAARDGGGKGQRGRQDQHGQDRDPRSWRGVAAETADELSAPIEALLRKRSRRLIGDLLRPHR